MREPSTPGQSPMRYQQDALWNVRQLSLFETVTPQELRKLHPLFGLRHYREGEFLFHAGDATDLLYFVEKGTIKVSRVSHEGDEHILDIFKAGDVFGELFVSGEHRRTAVAQALSAVTVRTLTEDAFKQLMTNIPNVCHSFVRSLVEDQRRTLVRLETVMHMGAGPRLLAFLLDLAERCGERTNGYSTLMSGKFTQGDMAHMVGMDRTTVTLFINRYRRKRILGGRGTHVVIHLARARDFLQKAGLAPS
jgi:CRP/FNR family cyclic AMP-dependent transcriptional regulator